MDWLAAEPEVLTPSTRDTWKVLIVDDDEEVHNVTRLSLTGFVFETKSIEFISAYSGDEAKELLAKRDDIALVLLDVVMESDDAGLKVANYIRNDLGNHFTRVVLRTGQPGFAQINDVLRDYDIDGYLSKTQISKQSLDQTFYIALRSYRDLARIQKYQKGLSRIIGAIANLNQIDQILELSQAVISQLNSVLGGQQGEFVIQGADVFTLTQNHNDTWRIIIDEQQSMLLDNDKHLAEWHKCDTYLELSNKGLAQKKSFFEPPHYVNYYQSKHGTETIVLLKTEQLLSKESKKLLYIFSMQVALRLENLLIK